MKQYIDIHSHILPGIDDGSKDFLTSIQMLKTAVDNGITQIIVTPHNKPLRRNADPLKITSLIAELKGRMADEGITIDLYEGNELYYRSGLAQEIMRGRALTMAGSDYVLVEFGPMDDYDYIRNGIYSLIAEGYRPVLAHVERYSKINGRADRVEDLIEMGCYMQVNAGSIMGALGLSTKLFTRKLLKEKLVHFVATDAHDVSKRSPKIAESASFIEKKYGEDYGKELLYENPMHVIRNEYI
ncbi:MAG: hypothetical protein Q4D94_13895 [Bacillota bacterium]|nr:hypothetical protein [Bacillota bacterium]